jgi:Zn-dependent metalloprotease
MKSFCSRNRSALLTLWLAASLAACSQSAPPPSGDADLPPTPQVETALDADPELATALLTSRDHLRAISADLGLDPDHGFRARSVLVDDLEQTHVRYDQLHRGLPVWGGDVIVHLAASGRVSSVTHTLESGIHLETTPSLSDAQALEAVHRDLRPQGPYAQDPTAELVVYPETVERVKAVRLRGPDGELNAEDMERALVRHVLAYHVHAELENGDLETDHVDYLIDAQSGDVLKKWSTLFTTYALGTGKSQYSGVVPLNTNTISGGWEMRDVARSMHFATNNMNHGTAGPGVVYTDADDVWGDGLNYIPGGSTTSANGQTAAVDVHHAAGRTFDYYLNIHGRNGIDGVGTATFSRVHYATGYDNAFWSDSCFCMTYGDGSFFKTLTSLDVGGHEMTHGVTSHSANLQYFGESGGLNEATSDIHGTMVEFHSRGGSGSTIGGALGTWTLGEQLAATPLRYMYKPSLDGASPDAWYSGIGNLDVHYSSGPMNRAFYFLSQGSSSTPASAVYSSYLPGGMQGVTNDHAARIAYRALTVYEMSTTNYAGARAAFVSAAQDLYGPQSAEVCAVQNAFAAINVGAACSLAPCTWTQWYDRDQPSGTGDWELRVDQIPAVCASPSRVECTTLGGVDRSLTGETVTCTPQTGFVCKNAEQSDGSCQDYRVRFCCP